MKRTKVVIITGGASGIGLATAKRFAQDGNLIVLADLNAEKLKTAKEEVLKNEAKDVLTCICDVSNEKSVERTIQETILKFGTLDVVVNNAGLMVFKLLEEHTREDWEKILNVDLMGAFYFIKHSFKNMKTGGAIVNVSSIHAIETTPNVSSYAAAKAALLSLTRSAAIEGKTRGIRVNAILPGAIDTPMLWANPNIKAGLEVINQNDVGTPENIASAIYHLASDESAFIQGTELRVDGGRLAKL
jgi:NAD(P)-dependent dehydrogenase (short-subunit alcohol dehydrogenase family)